MAAQQTKTVIHTLDVIRDTYNQACRKNTEMNSDILTRASLATSAFNLASHVDPDILEQIYTANVNNSGRNLPPLDAVSEKSILGIKRATMEQLADNIMQHVGRRDLDPSLKVKNGR